MKTLELILEHVQVGEVLVGLGPHRDAAAALCDRLLEKGVRAGHIVEERNGKPATVNLKKRAVVMRDSRHGSLQVLLSASPPSASGATSTPPPSSWSTGSCLLRDV